MKHGVDERRAERFRSLSEHGIVRARVRPGYDVALIDVSAGGALVEGARRLLPGTWIELHLAADERSASLRGRVLRCTVVALQSTAVWYRGAIRFDRDLPWFAEHDTREYLLPATETSLHRVAREAATPVPL